MRPKGSPNQVAQRRREAMELLKQGLIQKRLQGNIINLIDPNPAVSFQNAEMRRFRVSATTAFTFASTAKIALGQINLAAQQVCGIIRRYEERTANHIKRLQHGRIYQSGLVGCLAGRHFRFKSFYQPHPVFVYNRQHIYTSAGKVVNGISAALAKIPFIGKPAATIAGTSYTNNTAVFTTLSFEENSRFVFTVTNLLKSGYQSLAHHTAPRFLCQFFYNHLQSLKKRESAQTLSE